MKNLDHTIIQNRKRLQRHPPGNAGRALALYKLANSLRDKFSERDELTDLNEAVTLHRLALDLRPAGHPDRHESLYRLARCLWRRYKKQATTSDLEEAIILGRAALELRPLGHSGRVFTLIGLAGYLGDRFQKLSESADLDEAISLCRSALDLCSVGNADRTDLLHNLAFYFWSRYENQATMADLEEAIISSRAALELRPAGHAGRASTLNNLADNLRNRFIKLGEDANLDEAIALHRSALDLRQPGHSERSTSLNNLVDCLKSRFEKHGAAADLDELITLHRAILDLQPLGHPQRATSFHALLCHLRKRLKKYDRIADLNECISLERAILSQHEPRHSTRTTCLLDLASDLFGRFQKAGTVTDLAETITLGRTILNLHPPGTPGYATHLNTLLIYLRERLDKCGEIEDFNEAISLARQSLELRPAEDPGRISPLRTLASFLSAKFHAEGDLVDLEEAIALRRDISDLSPTASSLHELSLRLSDRFDQLADPADIDEAITLELSVLKLCLPEHIDWAMSRKSLVLYRQKKAKKPAPKADLDGIKRLIESAIYDTLESLPPRLLNTHTGALFCRDALASEFENSREYNQLLRSSVISYSAPHRDSHIRRAVSSYFQYVTLSHRWGKDEPLLRHVQGRVIYDMDLTDGIAKLQMFCATACESGYLWGWSDTCCIDKDSTVELARAIASMFSWYRRSALTIVYLADVARNGKLSSSEWFKRGWTLQELLAPRNVLFYTREWTLYKSSLSSNHKEDDVVLTELEAATGIARHHLIDFNPGLDSARSRLQWASGRRTTESEDAAYSLFGIFSVFLPIIPGESAENALGRLLTDLISQSGDISVLDWVGEASSFHSCFPARIASYQSLPCRPPTYHDNGLKPSKYNAQEFQAEQLFDSLLMSDPPHFVGRRLRLSCITHQVTAFRLQQANPGASQYVYSILAEGVIPLSITLSSELIVTDTSRSTLPYVLIRPWHSKFASYTGLDNMAASNLVAMLGQPFSALLLEEQSGNEYKRIASSSVIIARLADVASILRSKVQSLNVV